jgi:hypothetical protein
VRLQRRELPERLETQGLALEEPLFAAWDVMQRTETPWSNGLIERTTCQSSAGSGIPRGGPSLGQAAAATTSEGERCQSFRFGRSE